MARHSAALLLAWATAAVFPAPAAAKMPKIPKGMKIDPRAAQKGPPWRKALDTIFNEACNNNKGAPSAFCFPDKDALMKAMQVEQYGIDMTGEMYLSDVYSVMSQLMDWPPAWSTVLDVLDAGHVWTLPFCEKIIGGAPWWQPVPLARKSFMTPQHTMAQLEKDMRPVAESMQRWFEDLRLGGNSQTQQLLKSFKASDVSDTKNRTVHARPFMELMMQVHSRVLKHVFSTCKGSTAAMDKLLGPDSNGLTVLHHVASIGNAAGAKAILKALSKEKRAKFAAVRDKSGYTAKDWALLGDFKELKEVLDTLGGTLSRKKAEKAENAEDANDGAEKLEQSRKFPEAESGLEAQCRWQGSGGEASGCTAGTVDSGGWRPPATGAGAVPAEWLPQADRPCFAESIDVAQFDSQKFLEHFLLHPRPLLIRGGAGLSEEGAKKNYTREGLLEVAGDVEMEAFKFPSAKEYDGTTPMKKTLRDYVQFLDERAANEEDVRRKLQYAVYPLREEEKVLNFSNALPPILADTVEHLGSAFFIGGALMGVPLRHKAPSVTSLAYGRKLSFVLPPGREVVVHEAMYDFLKRTDGLPGAQRCMQEAGDAFYVPRGWSHGAICLGDCVGAFHEFSHSQWDLRDVR